ncbi:MAG TPA: hypothetical protein VN519_13150 [Bryobacteraceae bacterium]|nr:hypothetical protein [Bryobacteraceae bacterium]
MCLYIIAKSRAGKPRFEASGVGAPKQPPLADTHVASGNGQGGP